MMQKILFLFGELNDDDIDWIIASGMIEEIVAETVLIEEGSPSDYLYILLEGEVVVSVNVLENAKEVATLGTGEVFGEMSFIDGRPPSATVETSKDSLVLSLPRSLLAARLSQDVGFAARFNRAIALFLSSRLRIALTELDFGKDFIHPDEELSPVLLENLPLARARFDWLLKRIKNSAHLENFVTNH